MQTIYITTGEGPTCTHPHPQLVGTFPEVFARNVPRHLKACSCVAQERKPSGWANG